LGFSGVTTPSETVLADDRGHVGHVGVHAAVLDQMDVNVHVWMSQGVIDRRPA